MLFLQNISYTHRNKDLLFSHISLKVNAQDKIALIGNNGIGKSTLLQLIAGKLQATSGNIQLNAKPYYLPQVFGQYNHLTIAQALQVEPKIIALNNILKGNAGIENFNQLNDDWTIEERCLQALNDWQLPQMNLTQRIETLSGGQKTRVFLAGLSIHQPEFILMDEPSNHLDGLGRQTLYNFIRTSQKTMIIVSHDRKLLNLLTKVCELSKTKVTVYGGNYDFYAEQKRMEKLTLNHDIQNKEKALRKAREKERETLERQQRSDIRGKKKQEKSGVPKIAMNLLQNNAEKSTAKIKGVHAEKINGITSDLQALRASLPEVDKMKFGFTNSDLHTGKILFKANNLNYNYGIQNIWKGHLNFQLTSGERLALKGANGSGKTTLIKLILGNLEPSTGTVYRAEIKTVYIDQDYSLIDNKLNVYTQAQKFNDSSLLEHEIKIRLNRFLFTKDEWNKPCAVLSGGERMRLMLCCLTISRQSPHIIALDEPTNNLDIQNIEILTAAINEYKGTLLVISHDETFLEQLNMERTLELTSTTTKEN